MEKIKVAQIVGNASCGGVISCLMNYYRHIDRDAVRFDFFTYGPSPYDEEIRALGGEKPALIGDVVPTILPLFTEST